MHHPASRHSLKRRHEGWRLDPNARPSLSERGRAAADRPEIKAAGPSARLNPLSEVSFSALRHICRSVRPPFGDFLADPPRPRSTVLWSRREIGGRRRNFQPWTTHNDGQACGDLSLQVRDHPYAGAHRPPARPTLPGTPTLTLPTRVSRPHKKHPASARAPEARLPRSWPPPPRRSRSRSLVLAF